MDEANFPDLLSVEGRRQVIEDIRNEDNLSRKREQQKRFDVYRERQDRYILERLNREFSRESVNSMRKILSINLSTRIIDEMSSVYNKSPERSFAVADGKIKPNEEEQLNELYLDSKVNQAMRKANKLYNLHDQCSLMAVPNLKGGMKIKAIPPFHYDVIPDPINPEEAYAYVLNVWDFDTHSTARDENQEPTQLNRYRENNKSNESVADDSDRKVMLQRYVVWTAEFHYVMNGRGDLIGEVMPNPIGRLPFVDVADDKDFQFFVRRGTSVVDFALDAGVVLSDLSNIVRLQSYAQGVISSVKKPEDARVGPTQYLWLKQDPNSTVQPSFQFVSPGADIPGSLEFLEALIRLFLSSRGLDPGTVSGKGESRTFSSGIERLLSMIDKFEATRSDFDLFKNVEMELMQIIVGWSNAFQNVGGDAGLKESLKQATISDNVFMDIKFHEPMAVQTPIEKEDSIIKRMENDLMTHQEAIMELREVSEEKADEIIEAINEQGVSTMKPPTPLTLPPLTPEEEELIKEEEIVSTKV